MKNDSVRNEGYGISAEVLAQQYAFNEMGMLTVYAYAVLKNTRSQHVLEKVGFIVTHQDETYRYYKCEKTTWKTPNFQVSIYKAF